MRPEQLKWFQQPQQKKAHVWEISAHDEDDDTKAGFLIPICSPNEIPFKQQHEDDGVGIQKLSAKGLTLCSKCLRHLPAEINDLMKV